MIRTRPTILFFLMLVAGGISLTGQTATPGAVPPKGGGPVKAEINGKIIEEQSGQPIEYATVSLFNIADSTLVTGSVSNLEGEFTLETGPGNYFLKIEFISFKIKYIGDITVDRKKTKIDLGAIPLSQDAVSLAEVEVRAEKSQMQMALDKKVFNVGKDLASTSSSAADLLDNVPSVTVDVEGNVSLRGSDGVRVLVDGKPSGLVGLRGSQGLRSLPANLIDRIEIITNPSARYEAEGMTGIINIILKKDRRQGLNGSFDLTTGIPHNHGAAINLNYRKDKFNLFGNFSGRFREGPGENTLYQEYYRKDTITQLIDTFYLDQTRSRLRGGWSGSVRLGAEYFINEKNTLTSSLLYDYDHDNNSSDLVNRDYVNDFPGNLTKVTYRTESEDEIEPTFEYELNHKMTFEQKDREWNTSFQFRESTEEELADYYQESYTAEGLPIIGSELFQRSSNKENATSFLLQSDYIHPFGEEGKFETGYRGSIRLIDNNYLVEEFADDAWKALPELSNDFNYDEFIYAVYALMGNKPSRFSYQLGLRLEYSDVLTELLQTGESNQRDYLSLFPTAHFTYDFPGQNSVQISYSRRIRRPSFWELNPFFTFSDNRNIFRGNPNVDPEFTHSIEMGHIKYWDKTSISSSIYYRHTDGVIQRLRTLVGEGDEAITITQPENLATEDSYGLEFILSSDITEWWKADGSLNFFRSIIDGNNIGESFNADNFSWFGRINTRISLWEKYDLQLRFNYRAPQQTTQGKSKSMYHLDLGLSRDILKNKGTLTLSVRDLFNSRRYRFETFGDNFYSEGSFQWRRRQATLTFNYRLNQNKQRRGGQGGGGYDGGDMEF